MQVERNNRSAIGFALVYGQLCAIGMPVCMAGRHVENAAQRHLFNQVIRMKMEILLIRTCALVHALIGTTATWYMDNDNGADFVRISREVIP